MTQFIEPIAGFACERDPVFFWLDMAIWTTADRDAVKAAYLTAVTGGLGSVTVAGQTVQSHDPKVFADLLDRIQADLASSLPRGGIRVVQLVPGGCG
jgi:hypothetical protein